MNAGCTDTGIVAAASHNFSAATEAIPLRQPLLLVRMHADGSCDREVIGSVAGCLKADWQDGDWQTLCRMFRDPALQMVSFTITEKAMPSGIWTARSCPWWRRIWRGAIPARHTLSIAVALLYQRFLAVEAPLPWSAWTTAPKTAKSSGTAV